MIRRFLILLAAALMLAFPATAGAAYFISHDIANFHGREHFQAIGYRHAEAHCRPQTTGVARRGNLFHSWVCSFLASDRLTGSPCTGSVLIEGSASSYYRTILHRTGNCPHGG